MTPSQAHGLSCAEDLLANPVSGLAHLGVVLAMVKHGRISPLQDRLAQLTPTLLGSLFRYDCLGGLQEEHTWSRSTLTALTQGSVRSHLTQLAEITMEAPNSLFQRMPHTAWMHINGLEVVV